MEPHCGPWEDILPDVEKPSRYIGHEHNIIRKDLGDVAVRFALAFPDVYEIGMSHLGTRILYHIVNNRGDFAAERVYAPWLDMEARLRKRETALCTLESYEPLSSFDVVGFTIQHELCYTNILAMLELGGIPLRSDERGEADPLVIAGGPSAINPEPIADFLDAVALGDGEEVILEIGDAVAEAKQQRVPRKELLWLLSQIPGVYVPSLYRVTDEGAVEPTDRSVPATISPRIHEKLGLDDFPLKPLVPLTEAIHDRLSIEVMRGCPRTCRFCQATQVYSPCRTRAPEAVLEIARSGIESSGYDEISLVSLSTSEYPDLPGLASKLNLMFSERNIALSLPSLHPGTFTPGLAAQMTRVRRTGLTFAPEAGTQRLRRVIGKPMEEETILEALSLAYASGYSSVKLYFMVGLPGETREDLEGTVALARKSEKTAKSFGRGMRLSVSIAPFVPKPHTPFQWAAFEDPESLREKERFLRRGLRSSRIKLKWRNPEVSFLEAILARGDRRLGRSLETVFRSGARFDDWTDQFILDRWMKAFEQEEVDPVPYTRARASDERLPWGHLAVGRGEKACREEWRKAQEAAAEEPAGRPPALLHAEETPSTSRWRRSERYGRKPRPAAGGPRRLTAAPRRVRLLYSKHGCARFLSHLDVVRILLQALRRLRLPLQYTEGYTPRPKLAFGHPLPLGVGSQAELVDIWLATPPPPALAQLITRLLPPGMVVVETKEIFPKIPSLTETVNAVTYAVALRGILTKDEATERLHAFLGKTSWLVDRRTKAGSRKVDLRQQVLEAQLNGESDDPVFHITVRVGAPGQGKPRDLLAAVLCLSREEAYALRVDRTAQYIYKDRTYLSPMEAR